jgi:hypothetical protein
MPEATVHVTGVTFPAHSSSLKTPNEANGITVVYAKPVDLMTPAPAMLDWIGCTLAHGHSNEQGNAHRDMKHPQQRIFIHDNHIHTCIHTYICTHEQANINMPSNSPLGTQTNTS